MYAVKERNNNRYLKEVKLVPTGRPAPDGCQYADLYIKETTNEKEAATYEGRWEAANNLGYWLQSTAAIDCAEVIDLETGEVEIGPIWRPER